MAHQLYVLQVLTFNLLEERMMTKMDPNDQAGARGLAGVSRAVSSWWWSFYPQCMLGVLYEVACVSPVKTVWMLLLRTGDKAPFCPVLLLVPPKRLAWEHMPCCSLPCSLWLAG